MTDWLILLAFGVAWLAGWCSRWQWDRHNWEIDEPVLRPDREERQRRREERWTARFLLNGGWGTFVAPKADLPPDFVLPSLAPIPENPAVVVSTYGKGRHSR